MTTKVRIECSTCQATRGGELADVLRAAGHLRRKTDPEPEIMWEIINSAISSWVCTSCDAKTLVAKPDNWEDEGDGWLEARCCRGCRQVIPPERLEIFPDEMYCAPCRTKQENNPNGPDSYCPHCGSITEIRIRNRGGMTRYVEYCPACRG
jgi:hypothetical protein